MYHRTYICKNVSWYELQMLYDLLMPGFTNASADSANPLHGIGAMERPYPRHGVAAMTPCHLVGFGIDACGRGMGSDHPSKPCAGS